MSVARRPSPAAAAVWRPTVIFALAVSAVFAFFPGACLSQKTRHYDFHIQLKNVSRLCHSKSIVTVNGQFPGPKIVATEGDRIVINVTNHVSNNVTIHWHGVRQLRTGWADGPAYITQCPIQTGQSYVYNFTVANQRGTLFWHAHISWLRATVYGPIVIFPAANSSYPFPKPYREATLLFGEWYIADTEAVITEALRTGGGPNSSDAYTINGFPGPMYKCSSKDTFKLKVRPGKTYLLRLINAALDGELFFGVANHSLTVVEADALYVKPFTTNVVFISPGQTTNVLLSALPFSPNAAFLMAARRYSASQASADGTTVAAILQYPPPTRAAPSSPPPPLFKPQLPDSDDTASAAGFQNSLRSLASSRFPALVPRRVDRQFFFTVGMGTSPCEANSTCEGPDGSRMSASINNVSFLLPPTALLQAHFTGLRNGVYSPDFPAVPPFPFNYTGRPPANTVVSSGTRVVVLPFNVSVEVVLQDTSIVGMGSHPLHLHGFNFFVVGRGFGNFDSNNDPSSFNLVDPVKRNTVGVPVGGWVAIRFVADNPGVWYMHCHLEIHTSWGLMMAWVVQDGNLPNQKLPPPPSDLPQC